MSQLVRFTTTDLETLPDPLDDTRYELIDGELLVAKQPQWGHQFTSAKIWAALQAWSEQTGRGVANLAPGVIFTPEDDVAPDVVWVSHERLAQGMRADGHLYAAPELAVEVLSPGSANERRDRELKLKLYAREEVAEYWLVDWRAQTVAVYRRTGNELALADTLAAADTLASPLLPGFACRLSELWETSGSTGQPEPRG
jgi:Uma2 family endonuclease